MAIEVLWRNIPAYREGVEGDSRAKARVRRTFERDKKELRGLGIPIETSQSRAGQVSYRLARGSFHLPYLKLIRESRQTTGHRPPPGRTFEVSPEEANWVLEGLRELATLPAFPLLREAQAAFRKLGFDLRAESPGDAPVLYAQTRESMAVANTLKKLFAALTRRKRVQLTYRGMKRDQVTERWIRPYSLFFVHGRWYLKGHDELRNGLRTFRVSRMTKVAVNTTLPQTPDYTVPSNYTEDRGNHPWELAEDDEVSEVADVLLRAPRSLWAERNGHGELLEEREDDSHLRRFVVRRRGPFLRWILSMAGDAKIESPRDLQNELRDMARGVANLYGTAPFSAMPKDVRNEAGT